MCFVIRTIVVVLLFNYAASKSIIKNVPGFSGNLPFTLETGYLGIGDLEEVQYFYYFVESERNPDEDPLLLWLTGGPGCSGITGLAYEIGPLKFNYAKSKVNPTLELNPYSWTKIANIIFLDAPVGTGFSYATTWQNYFSSDTIQASSNYEFLTKGFVLGNPVTDEPRDINSRFEFAYLKGLIPHELYESALKNCNGNYTYVDPSNSACTKDLLIYEECIKDIFIAQILEPTCNTLTPRRSQTWNLDFLTEEYPLDSHATHWCRSYTYIPSYKWLSDKNVQSALQIREGTVENWIRCNYSIWYEKNLPSSFEIHQKLIEKGYQVLIYSGDHDMLIPYVGTLSWIKSLNLTIEYDWAPWFVDGQVAGYWMKYEYKKYSLTYATIKGGGHTAPEYKPKECFAMIDRWFALYPL
ncbi:serine carboxypeptidase-like 18 isoform X2 [Euphorbia lathyris]|uniref:serine carboxypeptidase-like 18 isoform X2 n=1 Tax=Euphorbia lathyris TaxID=212925 RepID=UPI0033140582